MTPAIRQYPLTNRDSHLYMVLFEPKSAVGGNRAIIGEDRHADSPTDIDADNIDNYWTRVAALCVDPTGNIKRIVAPGNGDSHDRDKKANQMLRPVPRHPKDQMK